MHVADEFIAGRGSQTTHHRFVVTIFGLYAREPGLSVPIGGLIDLLQELDVDSSSARSSVSRLKKKGVLEQTGKGRYALSTEAYNHLSRRNDRIYTPRHAENEGDWLMVVYTVPEDSRQARHLLRTGLQKMGFGSVNPGVWIAPAHLSEEATDYFETHDLTQYIQTFTSTYNGPGESKAELGSWWDLEEIELRYVHFERTYIGLLGNWRDRVSSLSQPELDAEAFKAFIPMFTQWRTLPFLDPGLPKSVLPRTWAGYSAQKLFNDLNTLLSEGARAHALRALAQKE
ncbi:PaaX family transcriptional regulator [Glutamicibacter sp. 363]|uniref:PaaX family transcriptional regulator n=1 Tax=unclassified Glutamicibacter TaxID=2627139 RepID=UPI001596CAD7|nr:PaaX family transcriptional regulator C-terminal domain-containing protein [Glutamicibacter sp. BW80]